MPNAKSEVYLTIPLKFSWNWTNFALCTADAFRNTMVKFEVILRKSEVRCILRFTSFFAKINYIDCLASIDTPLLYPRLNFKTKILLETE